MMLGFTFQVSGAPMQVVYKELKVHTVHQEQHARVKEVSLETMTFVFHELE